VGEQQVQELNELNHRRSAYHVDVHHVVVVERKVGFALIGAAKYAREPKPPKLPVNGFRGSKKPAIDGPRYQNANNNGY
jgi:hypothetical protein